MRTENEIDDLVHLLDRLDFTLPRIKYFDWNSIEEVRPCLEMLVKVIIDEEEKVCYLDMKQNTPVWVDVDRNIFSFEKVEWWIPISMNYMEGVVLGELLKVEHDKLEEFEKDIQP